MSAGLRNRLAILPTALSALPVKSLLVPTMRATPGCYQSAVSCRQAVALAWEGGRIHEMPADAKRLLLARMVHRPSRVPGDPFHLTESTAQRRSRHLLGERAIGIAEVGDCFPQRRLLADTCSGSRNIKIKGVRMKARRTVRSQQAAVDRDVSVPNPGRAKS